jgi:hypothetical protein
MDSAKRIALARRTLDELLTAYLMRALDALPKAKAQLLDAEMAPILRRIFKKKSGAWWQMLEQELALAADLGEKVKRIYAAQPKGADPAKVARQYAALILSSKKID